MRKRTANVSLIHRAGLAGMESQIKNSFEVKSDQYHDTVIYHSLIQAGVHSIRCIDGASLVQPDLIAKDRIKNCDGEEFFNLLKSINEMLEKHAVNGKQSTEQSKLFILGLFLTDLIYSLKTDAAMVEVLPLPKVESYNGLVSPHMLSVIGNLLPSVTPVDVLTPIPQLSLKANEVELFEELIESHIFSTYSNAHGNLEHVHQTDVAILADVSMKAKSVWQRFSNTVDLKQLTLSLMPITKNLADKVLTGLPGAIAGLLADVLTKAAQQEKRIVIYDYGRSHQALLVAHYENVRRLQIQSVKEDV